MTMAISGSGLWKPYARRQIRRMVVLVASVRRSGIGIAGYPSGIPGAGGGAVPSAGYRLGDASNVNVVPTAHWTKASGMARAMWWTALQPVQCAGTTRPTPAARNASTVG